MRVGAFSEASSVPIDRDQHYRQRRQLTHGLRIADTLLRCPRVAEGTRICLLLASSSHAAIVNRSIKVACDIGAMSPQSAAPRLLRAIAETTQPYGPLLEGKALHTLEVYRRRPDLFPRFLLTTVFDYTGVPV